MLRVITRLLVLTWVLHAPTAEAQTALDQFEPAPLPADGLALSGARLLASRAWALSLTTDYARAPLAYELGEPANLRQRVVSDHLVLHLSAAVAVHRRITAFASLPVHTMMRGEDILIRSARPEGAGLGDLRLGARFGLLERARGALAGELIARLPSAELTNAAQRYSGDRLGSYDASLVGELHIGIVDLRGRLGVRVREEVALANLSLGSALLLSVGGRIRIDAHWSALVELDASSYVSNLLAAKHTPAELLLGARYAADALWFTLAAGPGLTSGYGTPDVRVLATVGYGATRRSESRPPRTATEVPDSDGDGVVADRCPERAEDRDGVQDDDGCPDVESTAEVVAEPPAPCPPGVEARDGATGDDSCAEGELAAAPAPPVVDCTRQPDATPERCSELRAQVDDAVQAASSGESVAFGRVEYAVGKGSALASSISTLLAVRSILEQNPQIRRVRLEGHSDDTGNPEYNQFLARRRVRAVARWLVHRGISAERLEVFACGDRYPREEDPEGKGRQANRRVEFHVMDPPGAPHGHDQCEAIPLEE